MEEVQLAWDSLQAASSAHKKKLRAALELQKLLSSVSAVYYIGQSENKLCRGHTNDSTVEFVS